RDDAEEARAAGGFDPAWPVAVVLTGDGRQAGPREAIQTAPASASRHGFVVHVPGANHASLIGQRYGAHIVRAILQVEAAAGA
ncbi:MAG: alpha/beta hydrolase, partial [Caulobacteraceae bacterium]